MKKIAILLTFTFIGTTLFMNSCIKKGNDVPADESSYDPNLKVTHTISELLAMPLNTKITEDVTISGVVVMDDRSGNYYKKFVIQDTTGGIEINIDQNNIYNDYPIGRKVYVKCKGLTLAAYGGMKQLGYGIDERSSVVAIPFNMADEYIIKANYPNPIIVDTFTYDQLANVVGADKYLNKLVAIKDVQFKEGSYGVSYAQSNTTTNRYLEGCNASSSNIVLRTSNYSKFQAALTPTGSGTIVALYTKYNTTPQLIIRDTSDVNFKPERCGGAPLPGVTIYSEDFNSGTKSTDINIPGWVNYSEAGTKKFYYDGSPNNPSDLYAKISAYGSGENDVKTWLVTPTISLNNYSTYSLQVKTTYAFPDAATLKAYITTTFNGDPTASTWTELDPITVTGQSNWAWKQVDVAIPANFNNKQVYIAFKYTGSETGATSTFELDNIKVLGNN
ncbi:MAG TPA: DUF5689 domain-containing protein [Edaphocola sp.]|nr:DUF5689 domain-containing protein [Edaphocola sp.]